MPALTILLGGMTAPPRPDSLRALPAAAVVANDSASAWITPDSLVRSFRPDSILRSCRPDPLGRRAPEPPAWLGRFPIDAEIASISVPAFRPFPVVRAPDAPLFDYMWVLRSGIGRREQIEQVVARARAMRVRGLLVQVVARGDAFYRSSVLPRAESLPDTVFDPLGELLPLAHAAGLEVHAWVNCAVVWSGPRPPRDPRHILNAHPEWVVRVPGGRPMTLLAPYERSRLKLEGIFLSPAHRGVRTWVARVAQEIATRYAVDGIHLDYIRQPGLSLASDPMTRAGFLWRTGYDPERISELPREQRAAAESAWTAWQGEQVTAIVREVRDSLDQARPGMYLSAAVLADTVSARRVHAQPWTDWVRLGIIDRAFVMCYAPPVGTVHDEMQGYAAQLGTDGRVVPGLSVYNTPPDHAAAKVRAAVTIGYPLIALYSYDSLVERHGYWDALERRVRSGAAPALRPHERAARGGHRPGHPRTVDRGPAAPRSARSGNR